MKHKHFYSHLVEKTEITLEIADLNVSPEERMHLLALMEANIHSSIVSEILANLSEEDKKIFLKNLTEGSHENIWSHLKEKIQNAEEKIREVIKRVIKELLKDIREIK